MNNAFIKDASIYKFTSSILTPIIKLIIASKVIFKSILLSKSVFFETFIIKSCENKSNCVITLDNPKTDIPYYVKIVLYINESIWVNFTLDVLDCHSKLDDVKEIHDLIVLNNHTNTYSFCEGLQIQLSRIHLPRYFTDGFFIKHDKFHFNTISLDTNTYEGQPLILPFQLLDYLDNGLTLAVKIEFTMMSRNDQDKRSDIYFVAGCLSYRHVPILNVTSSHLLGGGGGGYNATTAVEIICQELDYTYPLISFGNKPALLHAQKARRNVKRTQNSGGFKFAIPQRNFSQASYFDGSSTTSDLMTFSRLNEIKIPYPATGQYVLYLKPFCLRPENENSNAAYQLLDYNYCRTTNHSPIDVAYLTFHVILEPCMSEQTQYKDISKEIGVKRKYVYHDQEPKFASEICGGMRQGFCQITAQQSLFISACRCLAGWEGIGCTNGTRAMSFSKQVANVIFLTLSNLAFVPAIIYSLKARMFSESAIYTTNLLFSMFYHACDEDVVKFCIGPYQILQYMDFYNAILSMLVTAMAIAALPISVKSFYNLTLSVVLAFLVQINKLDVWTFLGPLLFAAFVMITSWVYKSLKTHSLYPPKRVLIRNILPGLTIAFIGLLLFCFGQNKANYPYIHSVWHMLMAFSIYILIAQTRCHELRKNFCSLKVAHDPNNAQDHLDDALNLSEPVD